MMLLSMKGHLVPAPIASSRLLERSGNMFSLIVGSCTLLVQMPSGWHSVKYVTGVIVG
jgi:hypothetical protein